MNFKEFFKFLFNKQFYKLADTFGIYRIPATTSEVGPVKDPYSNDTLLVLTNQGTKTNDQTL